MPAAPDNGLNNFRALHFVSLFLLLCFLSARRHKVKGSLVAFGYAFVPSVLLANGVGVSLFLASRAWW